MTLTGAKQITLTYILLTLFLLAMPTKSVAELIYEWTNPWGQVQYSKTPIPGSRVSEVTTLPKAQKTSEEIKKQAMSLKIQQMNAINLRNKENAKKKNILMKQNIANKNYCSRLRTLLVDVRLKINRVHSGLLSHQAYLPGNFLLNSAYYQTQEEDILLELRKSCR